MIIEGCDMIDSQKIIESLTEWISLRLSQPMSIEQVALKAGYNKWHLQRMFRRVRGTTINAYIRNCRLERASEELLQTTLSITEVAQRNGYNSQSSFSRAFTQRFSVTPTEYRRVKSFPP